MFNEAKYYEVLNELSDTQGTNRYTNTVIATAFSKGLESKLNEEWLKRHLSGNVEVGILTEKEAYQLYDVYKDVIESLKAKENKVMKKRALFTFEDLYHMCNNNNWFTCGDNSQYNKLFDLNKEGASIEELALVIYICSDCSRESILNKLKENYRRLHQD